MWESAWTGTTAIGGSRRPARSTIPIPRVPGGGIGGGSLATYGICTVVFGLPTSGASVIWCGVLAGGAGAFGVGMALGAFGEMIAEFVYERKYQVSPQ